MWDHSNKFFNSAFQEVYQKLLNGQEVGKEELIQAFEDYKQNFVPNYSDLEVSNLNEFSSGKKMKIKEESMEKKKTNIGCDLTEDRKFKKSIEQLLNIKFDEDEKIPRMACVNYRNYLRYQYRKKLQNN